MITFKFISKRILKPIYNRKWRYTISIENAYYSRALLGRNCKLLTPLQKKYPVNFDDELRIGNIRYDNMT